MGDLYVGNIVSRSSIFLIMKFVRTFLLHWDDEQDTLLKKKNGNNGKISMKPKINTLLKGCTLQNQGHMYILGWPSIVVHFDGLVACR